MRNWSNNVNDIAGYDSYGIEGFGDNLISSTKHNNMWDQPQRHHNQSMNTNPYTTRNRQSSQERNYRNVRSSVKPQNTRNLYEDSLYQSRTSNQFNHNHPVKNFDEIFDNISSRFDSLQQSRPRENNFFNMETDRQDNSQFRRRAGREDGRNNLRSRFDRLESDLNASFDNFATKLRPVSVHFYVFWGYFNSVYSNKI